MFVLVTATHVKPNADGAFAQAFEEQLVPSLCVQPGFKGEMLFVVPGGPDAVAITFWESRETAESFQRRVWPELLKSVAATTEPSSVRFYQLAHSTLHEKGAASFPTQSPITTDPTGVGA